MSIHTWKKWEAALHKFLEHPRLLQQLNEYADLNAHHDPTTGRITYTKIVNKSSFGALSDIVTDLVPRETIQKVPSIAAVLGKYAWVYPKYYVQFASLEEEDFEFEDMDEIDPIIAALDAAPRMKPLIGICILDNDMAGMYHGTAFIAWRTKKSKYTFCFYDPLAYQRVKTRADGSTYFVNYDYARMTFQSHRFSDYDI